jgi:6-pyruvoyl-tetrahydropterin synthase related domain
MTDRLAKLCENVWFCLAVICGVSFLTTILPVLITGLHASGDLSVYLGFAQEIRSAIEQGRYFPGWANDTFGYGSLGIRFYPPIGYYTSAIVFLFVGDWYTAVCIFLFLWMAVGCWGMFLFVRDWTSPPWALAAAGLYALVPFHLAEIYQFTLYGEFAASGILPYCLLYAARLCRRDVWADVIGFAISTAALILTHVPTSMIGAVGISLYILLMIQRRRFGRTVAKFAISTAAALAASAFYWIRVVTEVDWLAHAQPQYAVSLGGRANWFFPYLLTAANAPDHFRPVLRSFDAMVILTSALFIPAIILFALRPDPGNDDRRTIRALALVGAIGIFMLSYGSYFIWDRVELLQKIQFPWRWLTVVSAVAVGTFVLASSELVKAGGHLSRAVIVFLIALTGLIVAYDVRKNFMYGNIADRTEFEAILNERNIAPGTSFAAWLPVWARSEALAIPDKVIAGNRPVEIKDWRADQREFRIGGGPESMARVATFYYPLWKATVNDESVKPGMDENGAIIIPISTAVSEVRLSFEEPPLNRLCLVLSMSSWFAVFAFMIFLRVKREN